MASWAVNVGIFRVWKNSLKNLIVFVRVGLKEIFICVNDCGSCSVAEKADARAANCFLVCKVGKSSILCNYRDRQLCIRPLRCSLLLKNLWLDSPTTQRTRTIRSVPKNTNLNEKAEQRTSSVSQHCYLGQNMCKQFACIYFWPQIWDPLPF